MSLAEARSESGTTRIRVELALPPDLVDLRHDGLADHAAAGRLADDAFPGLSTEARADLVDSLMTWRGLLESSGTALHGLVSVPASQAGTTRDVCWQILAGAVPVPTAAEADQGELLARLLGSRLSDDSCYLETFPTESGRGVGLITELEISPAPAADGAGALPPRVGLCAALSVISGEDVGLAVIGVCLDHDTTLQLSAVVTSIAVRSRLHREA